MAASKLVLPASRHFAPIAPASHTGASCANGRGSPCVCSSHLLCFAALCGRSEAGKQVAYSLCTALQVYAGGGDVGSPARRHPGARRCHQALRRASAAFQIHPRFAPESAQECGWWASGGTNAGPLWRVVCRAALISTRGRREARRKLQWQQIGDPWQTMPHTQHCSDGRERQGFRPT